MINIFIEGLPRGKMAKDLYSAVKLEKNIRHIDLKSREELGPGIIPVHFTVPDDVNPAAEFYCEYNAPFVMGTTGGNRWVLEQRIKESNICAVVDINMAKNVVGLRGVLRVIGEEDPGRYSGFYLKIIESHPSSKKDVSGTALSMIPYFNKLGIPNERIIITLIRNRAEQLEMGVPKEALDCHAWHQYLFRTEDGRIIKYYEHKFNDRSEYVNGTIKAIRFLDKKAEEGVRGKVYSMEEVHLDSPK